MLIRYPNLPQSIYFFITFHKGSFFEKKNELEFTHIAEHLLFSGLKDLPTEKAKEQRERLFSSLSAVTNFNSVSLYGYFPKKNVIPAFQYLHRMIYYWECSREQWEKEKKMLWKEYQKRKNYGKEYIEMHNLFLKNSQKQYWNQTEIFQEGPFTTVKKIHTYWNTFIKKAPLQISLIGDISPKDFRYISKLFSISSPKSTSKKNWKKEECGKKQKGQKIILWYKSPQKNVGSFFFEEILKLHIQYPWFLEIQDYSTFQFPKKIISKIKNPSLKDFSRAHKKLVVGFESLLTGNDWFAFLDQASYIQHHRYLPFNVANIYAFTEKLKKYTFSDYKKWWDETGFEKLLKDV